MIPGQFGENPYGEMKWIIAGLFGEKILAQLAKKFITS
jgi:hypothetical protein